MQHLTFKHLLLSAASFCLLAACYQRRQQPVGPADAPTAAPAATTSAPNQPAAPASPTSATGAPTTASTATKSGWWVRINTGLTTAQSINFQIGTGKQQREEWRVWRAGEAAEFDVPANYAQAPRLYLRGSVTPIGKFADLCLMYKDHGVEHMGFNDDDSETKSQTQVDYKCR